MAADSTLRNTTSSGWTAVFATALARAITGARARLYEGLFVCATRERIADLDDRVLRDLGFDPELARREAAKPFWKPYTLMRRQRGADDCRVRTAD
jgi:hypothetical protein